MHTNHVPQRGGVLLDTETNALNGDGDQVPVYQYVPVDDTPADELPAADARLNVGDAVMHDVIGPGTVVGACTVNGRTTVVVEFLDGWCMNVPIPNAALRMAYDDSTVDERAATMAHSQRTRRGARP